MDATLYGIPGSHPVKAAELMLEHKHISFRRVDLMPGQHQQVVHSQGFSGKTVPAVLIAGGRLQGTRTISRGLDGLRPEPSLFPCDPTRRTAVEEAERFGEETLQPLARRLVLAAGARDLSSLWRGGEGGTLGAILAHDADTRRMIMQVTARHVFEITDEREQADLANVWPMLGRIEGWMETDLIGGAERNAADYQIAPSICLLMYRNDLADAIRSGPSGELAETIALGAGKGPTRGAS
jgi:glutathione S-transferase